MPWFWERKSAKQGNSDQDENPVWPSVWGAVAQILNWVTSPTSDQQEVAQFGDSAPNSMFKIQLLAVGEKKEQKSVTGSGRIFLSVLSNVWDQLKGPWRKVQQQAEGIIADKVQQDLLREALERTQDTGDSTEEGALTMGAWFGKLKKKQCIPNLCNFISTSEWIPEIPDEGMWNFDEEESSLMEENEGGETVWATKAPPLVTNKSKGPPGKLQASQATQTVRNYTQQELADMSKSNRQKPGERLSQWLLRMRDQGATNLYLTGEDLVKLGALSKDTLINQYFSLPKVATSESLFDWCTLAIQYRYPAAMNWEVQMPLWHSIEEAMVHLRGMAMQEAIYQPEFTGPDTQHLTDGMNVHLIKGAPSYMHTPLLTLLGPAQGISVGEAVVLIGRLEDVPRENVSKPPTQVAKEGDNFQKRKSKNRISRRQMFMELLKEGMPKADIRYLPNLKLYKMWKEKCATDGKRLQENAQVKKLIPAAPFKKQLYHSLPRKKSGEWKMSQLLDWGCDNTPVRIVKTPKAGDQRPYLPLTIYWPHKKTQRVMALVDTGSEVTLIYGNPTKHCGQTVYINGYGNGEERTTQVQLKLAIGRSSPFMAKVMISAVREYIIGIDLLQGREFRTPKGRFAFGV